jgi:hypothetical protein
MSNRSGISAVTAVLLLWGGICQSEAASIITFHNRPAWEAAAGAVVLTDTFGNDLHTGFFSGPNSFTLDSGIISSANGASGAQCNGVQGGQFLGCAGLSGDFIEWRLPIPVTAFAADLDLTVPTFISDGLDLTIFFDAGGSAVIDIDAFLAPATDGFFGFTSDRAFSMVKWTSPQGTVFNADNLALAAVAEPSSFLLLGSGLLGLASWRWRKNRAATS